MLIRAPLIVHHVAAAAIALTAALMLAAGGAPGAVIAAAAAGYGAVHWGCAQRLWSATRAALRHDPLLKLGWILLFCSVLLWRARSSSALVANPLDPASLLRIAQVGLAGLLALFTASRRGVEFTCTGPVGLLAAYASFGICSTLWSSQPLYTAYKATETLVVVVFGGIALSRTRSTVQARATLDVVLVLYGALACSVWLGAAWSPELALPPAKGLLGVQLNGVLPVINPNSVGFFGAVLGFIGTCRAIEADTATRRLLYRNVAALGVATMVFAQSRTSLAGFAAIALWWLASTRRIGRLTLVILLTTVVAFSAGIGDLLLEYLTAGRNTEMLTTLTGRTTVWSHALERYQERPLFGFGFASGARFDVLLNSEMVGLHGSVFDVLVNTGAVGAVLWCGALLGGGLSLLLVTGTARRAGPAAHRLHLQMTGLYGLLLVRGTTSTSLVMHDSSFLLLVLIIAYAQRARRTRAFARDSG